MALYREIRRHVFAPLAPGTEAPEQPQAPPPSPDLEMLAAAALDEGFRQGYAEGLARAGEEHRHTTQRLADLVANAAREVDGFVRGLEREVIQLSLAVAAKVIEREARTDPGLVVGVVRATLEELSADLELRLRVHPDDFELLESRWGEALPETLAQQCQLVADERVERRGCIIETATGRVDGQLSTRLEQVRTAFEAVLEGEPT